MNFVYKILGRFAFYLGVIFTGTSLLVGGMKFYEHSTYRATQALVLGTTIKCEMSYKTGRSRTEHVVECNDVNTVKARYPDVDWRVAPVTFVQIGYRLEDGRAMTATVRLGKLELESVTVGET